MHSFASFRKTAWVTHRQFAETLRSLWGEPLLLYRKKRDDDGGLLIGNTNTGEQGQQHPAGGVEIPPAQIALGFEKRINAIALDTLLSNFEKYQGNEDALRRYLEQNRDEITATVYEQGGHSLRTAKRVQQAITEKAMRPAEIRSLIAECIAPKPEKDEDLTKALKQNEKQEKAETPAKKKSRWKLLLAEIAKMQHPLYRAIASFLTNAAVERMDLSPDTIFQELQDRGKRLSLFRRIASTRHDLVLPQSGNAEERLRALQSLYAIFHYGEYLLDSTEQGEYFELSARVIAAMTVVEAEIAMEEQKPEEEAEAKKKETYAESEEIREFLRKEHEKKRTLTGNDGIAKRLEEKGAEKGGQNVFSILGKACEQGGWLQALRPRAEGLKYTCALITLEEIALLKHEIAFGRATEPVSLLERVKGTVLTLLQRGARGFPRERAGFIPLIEDSTEKARADFASLEKRIAATDHPLKADVEEILVLHSWLMSNEPTFDESHTVEKKIGEWRKNALSSSDDLRREATRARTNIAELLEDTSPEGAEILREANPEVLLKALADVSEERIIGENRKRLQHYEDLLPPEKSQKIYREPSLLHRKSDLEYAMKREKRVQELVEQNVSLAAVPKDSTIKALDHEYEQGRILRLAMHESFTAEQEEKILRVLEAEIHAESASLLESFSKKLKQRMEERLNVQDADVEKMATVIEEMPWEKWPEAVTEDEIATILALEKLYPPFSLRSEPDPLSAANIALQALKALTNDVRDADEIAEEEKRRREKTKNTARKIVENPKSTRVIREVLEPVANGKVNLRSTTENRINIFQSVDAQKVTASVLEKKISLQEKAPQTTREIRGVEEEFRSIEQSIEQILPSYLGASDDAFGTKVRGEIAREVGGIGVLLRSAKEREDRGSRFLIDAKWRIDSLKRLIAILEKNQKEYTELEENEFAKYVAQEETLRDKPGFVFGVYSRTEKKIVLNKTAIDHYGQSMRELTLSHERRHALHDALREVFPTFLTDVYDALHLTVPELEKRGEELMSREGLSEAAWKDEVMDELLVRHSVYEQNKEKFSDPTRLPPGLGVGRKDIELFEAMNTMELPLNFQEGGLRNKGRTLVAQNGQGAPAAPTPPAAPVRPSGPVQRSPDYRPPPLVESSSIPNDFEKIRQGLIKINTFLNASASSRTQSNLQMKNQLEVTFENVKTEFNSRIDIEENTEFRGRVTSLKSDVEKITKAIGKWDTEQRDLRHKEKNRGFLKTFWYGMEIMSINDFIAIYQAIAEDIKRSHHRRQQGRIGRVGKSLTEWITHVPLLKDLPYLGTLSAEFHARDKHAEGEEIENWKKSLTEVDSYELQEMLHHPSNADHMRAILTLLAERGRVNWGDKYLWRSLSRFSGYKIPEEECERDENLREDWLRKTISEIYEDKDLYRHWRTQNDGAIKSKKSEFTTEVDRISNLSGGMTQELAKQLKLYIHATHHHEPIPDDVQPHLYEEIIHFAMRNGKMTMEDKFYYLVQGIAFGLISRDRLAVIAGEGGEGLLNTFPFIDYFYGRNNTLHEIRNLADRLRESDDETNDDYYKPGAKTTMWLELEVAREDSVQKRLSKGMIKRGQETDHDDMHFFIPRLSYKTIDQLTTPAGGGRPQLSDQAWMNAYSGFNSYFKSFGIVAKLEDEHLGQKFSSTDINDVVRAIATFVRMDGIMTQRSAFDDNGARRMALTWDQLRTQRSVVNESGETVYEERGKVDRFVKAVIDAYGFEPEYTEVMLYDTSDPRYGPFNEQYASKSNDKVFKLSNGFGEKLRTAILEQGAGKLRDLLVDFEPEFKSHNTDYTYENAKQEAERQRDHAHAPQAHTHAAHP